MKKHTDQMYLDPEQRICEEFDSTSIAKYPIVPKNKAVPTVIDNCAEDHIM